MTLDEHRVFFSKFAKHLGLSVNEHVMLHPTPSAKCKVRFESSHEDPKCYRLYIADAKRNFETDFEFISDISICDAYQLVLNFLVKGCEIRINRKTVITENITNYSWERIKIPTMSSEEELMLWFAANWGI